jgi:predicted DsbA family dithiol-disulfide isomerase
VRWLPFQLNPDLPESGIPREEYLSRKFGARGHSYERVAAVGATVGIDFAFARIRVQPNTLNAHRLMHFAERHGAQDAIADALFRAYFTEGANITDSGVLAEVAAGAGLDGEAVTAYLESDSDRDLILGADAEARAAGITGVPFFIFNGTVGVSGAQDAGVLLEAMEEAAASDES